MTPYAGDAEAEPGAEQAVLIHLDGAGRPDRSFAEHDFAQLEDRLSRAMAAKNVGQIDGHEISADGATVYAYGPDAEHLFEAIAATLTTDPLCRDARVVIRRGGPGSPEREVYISTGQSEQRLVTTRTSPGKVRRKRLKPGDVLRVEVDGAAAYLQFLGKHAEYGDAVRVLDTDSLPPETSDLDAVMSSGYVAFYPATAACLQGLAEVVAHSGKGVGIPVALRRPARRARDGAILNWVIETGRREYRTDLLSDEERAMPIAAIWNHEMLCSRIRQRWRPDDMG